MFSIKELSIKDLRSQGGEDLYNADIFRTRGVLQMRMSALLDSKNFGFFEIYGVSARTRGVNFFLDFVRTSFMVDH